MEFLIIETIEFDFYFTADLWKLLLRKPSDYIRVKEKDHSLLQLTLSNGSTIFHVAVYYGRLQVMEAINNIDARMKDGVNQNNRTPLMIASYKDQVACVKWLLDHNADINIRSVHGETALDHAKSQKIKDMIKEK